MARTSTTGNGNKSAKPGREDRLKAALKANMARRKAQTRARMGANEPDARTGADETNQADQSAHDAKGRTDG